MEVSNVPGRQCHTFEGDSQTFHRGAKYSTETPQMFLVGAKYSTETLKCSPEPLNAPCKLSKVPRRC